MAKQINCIMVCHLAAGIKVIDFPVSSKYLYTVVLPNRDDIQRELGINRKQNQKPVKSIQCENINGLKETETDIYDSDSHSNDAVEKIIFNLPFSRKSGPEFISQIDLLVRFSPRFLRDCLNESLSTFSLI